MRVNLLLDSVERLAYYLVHLRHQIPVDIDILVWPVLVNVTLEAREAQHVAVFEVPIVLGVLLHSVVSQVHKCIVNIGQIDPKLS